ncbi:cuticle protein 8-like [Pectinophora gossypiella]|uniref:cuticle protein 8-like n=1 Tax=Pectinophora gossypiella TaxID=13191 RepID=UPI00214F2EE3|nr:cuticle protein 8-like [Pectinophora gossypiella]
MVVKFAAIFCVVAAAAAVVVPGPVAVQQVAAPVQKLIYAEPEAPAQYEYEYSINDPQTGDVKSSKENRNGDDVHGYYSLVQPDGVQRIVEYTSSKEHGFNAVVRYEGQAKVVAPAPVALAAPVAKVAYAPAPVAKVAYAQAPVAYAPAPVAKVAYAQAPVAYAPAPVAKVAYAAPAQVAYAPAPVAKVAYAQPVAKVAYSPAASVGHVTYASPSVSYSH